MPNTSNLVDRRTLIETIKSKDGRRNVLLLQNNEAQTALMLLQEVSLASFLLPYVNNNSLPAQELNTNRDPASRQAALKMMIELAKRSDQFPPTLWLSDISLGEHLAGGGYGEVYKGSWSNKNTLVPVALKISRWEPDLQKQKVEN